jgi:hypothetical protein
VRRNQERSYLGCVTYSAGQSDMSRFNLTQLAPNLVGNCGKWYEFIRRIRIWVVTFSSFRDVRKQLAEEGDSATNESHPATTNLHMYQNGG